MNLNKLLIAGSVFTVLFITSFSVAVIIHAVEEAKEAKQYCESINKVVVKMRSDYICVEPEDKV